MWTSYAGECDSFDGSHCWCSDRMFCWKRLIEWLTLILYGVLVVFTKLSCSGVSLWYIQIESGFASSDPQSFEAEEGSG